MLRVRKSRLLVCLISAAVAFTLLNSSWAAVCAFRNPDKDVYLLFPDATNYRSVFAELNEKNRGVIEEDLGQSLDLNDIGTNTFYVILKGERPIGFIHTHAIWGTYGNVEVIWAFNIDGSIKDYIIQRSRERKTKELESEDFRNQFKRKKLGDPFTLGKSKNINPEFIKPVEGGEKESSVIAYGARKILILEKYLFQETIEKAREEAEVSEQ